MATYHIHENRNKPLVNVAALLARAVWAAGIHIENGAGQQRRYIHKIIRISMDV